MLARICGLYAMIASLKPHLFLVFQTMFLVFMSAVLLKLQIRNGKKARYKLELETQEKVFRG